MAFSASVGVVMDRVNEVLRVSRSVQEPVPALFNNSRAVRHVQSMCRLEDGKRLVVVGDRGHILFSDDQGSTWTQARVPTRQLLTAVFFLDDKRGWAVGHDAQILTSSDGGATWSKQFEDLAREAPLLDVTFLDARHGFAVGAYGALLETTDGGQHDARQHRLAPVAYAPQNP